MKKIVAILLCAVMMLGLLPASAFAADVTAKGKCGKNAVWTFTDDGVLTISGVGATYDYNEYYPDWYEYVDDIDTIVIKSGITKIGFGAFEDHYNVTSVVMADTVTYIGHYAFNGCSALKNIEIPSSVTFLGECAFSNCRSLNRFNVSQNVTNIGPGIFAGCPALKGVTVDAKNAKYSSDSDGVLYDKAKTTIICAFSNLEGEYIVREGIRSVGVMAFINCDKITELYLPASLESFDEAALICGDALTGYNVAENSTLLCNDANGALYTKDMDALVFAPTGMKGSFTVPDGVKYINICAFYSCRGINEVILPDTVDTIGEFAFEFCGITSITIPVSVKNIMNFAFAYTDLKTVKFEGDAPKMENDIFTGDSLTVYYPQNYSSWKNVVGAEFGADEITWQSHVSTARPIGDVNNDKILSNADLVAVARFIVGVTDGAISVEDFTKYGDMNGDGDVTNADLVAIAKELVK